MKKFRWPYLELYLALGFFTLRTAVMCERYESLTFEYIALEWALFRWSGRIRLYAPNGKGKS